MCLHVLLRLWSAVAPLRPHHFLTTYGLGAVNRRRPPASRERLMLHLFLFTFWEEPRLPINSLQRRVLPLQLL